MSSKTIEVSGKQSRKANVAGSSKMADQPEIYRGDLGKEMAKVGPL